jgi:hypothetical protein
VDVSVGITVDVVGVGVAVASPDQPPCHGCQIAKTTARNANSTLMSTTS